MVNYALTQNGLVCHLAQFKTLIRVAVEAIEPGIVREPSARFPHLANLSRNEFTSEWCVSDYLDCIRLSMVPRSEDVIDLASKMHPDGRDGLSSVLIIGELLATDVYVNKVARRLLGAVRREKFINSDISQFVAGRCIRDGLVAIWQNATNSFWIRDGSVDGVLMAYGTHHAPCASTAVRADGRILPPGCILVLHDFEVGSRTARWFADIVSIHSVTPHDYLHFAWGRYARSVPCCAVRWGMCAANHQSLRLLRRRAFSIYRPETV